MLLATQADHTASVGLEIDTESDESTISIVVADNDQTG